MASDTTYLRCALVWERTILEEHLFPPGTKVTIGESPRATFTLQSTGAGKRAPLFQHTSRGTVLSLIPGMHGKVSISGVTREVDELLTDTAFSETDGNAVQYNLSEGDGGVLVFGRTGLMFNTVTQVDRTPPARIRQILGSDPFTSKIFGIVLAMVMLFSLVSRLFAGTTPGFEVEQLPDRLASFVVEDPEAIREFKQEIKKARQEELKRQQEIKEEAKKARKKDTEPKTNEKNGKPIDAETAKIKKKVATKGMVGALSVAKKRKGALKDVMGNGGLGMSLNSAVKNLERGAATARLLTSTGSGGIAVPGLVSRRGTREALGEGIADVKPETGATGRRMGRTSRLSGRSEAQVTLAMPSSAAQVTGGELSRKEIFTVVNRNKGAIRYCYESQLMRFPTLRGKITVDFIIDTNGSIKTVKIQKNGLSQAAAKDKVANCLIKFIKRWRFPKPRGGKVRVIYPFTFGRK